MWKEILEFTPDRQQVLAKLGAQTAAKELNRTELPMVLAQIGVGKLFILDEAVTRFINSVKEGKRAAFEGIVIAEVRNATVSVVLGEKEMLASMVVTGRMVGEAYVAMSWYTL